MHILRPHLKFMQIGAVGSVCAHSEDLLCDACAFITYGGCYYTYLGTRDARDFIESAVGTNQYPRYVLKLARKVLGKAPLWV